MSRVRMVFRRWGYTLGISAFCVLGVLQVFNRVRDVADGAPPELVGAAARYFSLIQEGDVERALGCYAPEFFERTKESVWLDALLFLQDRGGPLLRYSLIGWRRTSPPNEGMGDCCVELTFDVEYERKKVREVLTFGVRGRALIVGHNITAEES